MRATRRQTPTCSLDFDFGAQKGCSPRILLYFTSFNNLGNSSPAKLAFVIFHFVQ